MPGHCCLSLLVGPADSCDKAFSSALSRRIRGNGEVIKRSEFLQRQEVAEAARIARRSKKPKKLYSEGKDVSGSALLQVQYSNYGHC